MSYFKYEIDERSLRLQLQANKLPFNEEAWQKFESFAETNKSSGGDEALKRVHLSLNRNVVLPVVFGTVIISFSLLLFNFINIKRPNSAQIQPAQVKQASMAAPVITKKETPAPAKAQPAIAEVKKDTVAVTVATVAPQPAPVEVQPQQNARVVTAQPAIEATHQRTDNTVSSTTASQPRVETTVHKRPKKRAMIATEASTEDEEQAPPPAAEPAQ